MKKSTFFNRSELTATLWAFRQEFLIVGLLSFLSNLLMLALPHQLSAMQMMTEVLPGAQVITFMASWETALPLYV